MIDADTINAAYKALTAAQVDVFNANGSIRNAQRKLDARRSELLSGYEIDGKNAETREAQLKTRSEEEMDYVADADGLMREAELRLRSAQNEVERCKTLLKLLEVTK